MRASVPVMRLVSLDQPDGTDGDGGEAGDNSMGQADASGDHGPPRGADHFGVELAFQTLIQGSRSC